MPLRVNLSRKDSVESWSRDAICPGDHRRDGAPAPGNIACCPYWRVVFLDGNIVRSMSLAAASPCEAALRYQLAASS